MDDYGWNNDENNEEIEVKIIKYNKNRLKMNIIQKMV